MCPVATGTMGSSILLGSIEPRSPPPQIYPCTSTLNSSLVLISTYCYSYSVVPVHLRCAVRSRYSFLNTSDSVHIFVLFSQIYLSSTNLSENTPAGTIVGSLTTIDFNIGDTHTYSFADSTSGIKFGLKGSTLVTKFVPDFESLPNK